MTDGGARGRKSAGRRMGQAPDQGDRANLLLRCLEPLTYGPGGDLSAGTEVELIQDVLDVGGNGPLADV